jgi:hypothetical protein
MLFSGSESFMVGSMERAQAPKQTRGFLAKPIRMKHS